jgi:peptidoglycan/LPS O-acetylase OafA/YrhL
MTFAPSPDRSSGHPRIFDALDGLRGIAAIAIAIVHAPFLGPRSVRSDIFYDAYLAVDFFFVLSGFVLAYSYSRRLETDLSPASFMIMRLIRLYPLYLLAMLAALIVEYDTLHQGRIGAGLLMWRISCSVLFLPTLLGHSINLYPLNFPAWSLFSELIANAAFARLGKRLATPVLIAIVAAAGLALIAAVAGQSLGFGELQGAMNAGVQWPGFAAGLLRVGYSFFAGVLVFRIWRLHGRGISIRPLALATILIAILVAPPWRAHQIEMDLVVTMILFPAIVLLGANGVVMGLEQRLFVFLGRISYGLYVLQIPIYGIIKLCVGRDEPHWTWAAASISTVVLVAAVIEKYFDRPIRRRLTAAIFEASPPAFTQQF